MRAAEELADLERSDEDILDAHDVASAKFGEPVYMVAKIVDSLPAIDVDDDAPANLDALYLEAHPHG